MVLKRVKEEWAYTSWSFRELALDHKLVYLALFSLSRPIIKSRASR